MKKRLWPWLILAGAVIVFTASGGAIGINPWVAAAIAIGALFVNGLLATLEDDVPGGFNNPDGTRTPKYVRTVAWSVRAVGVICLLLIAVLIGFAAFG